MSRLMITVSGPSPEFGCVPCAGVGVAVAVGAGDGVAVGVGVAVDCGRGVGVAEGATVVGSSSGAPDVPAVAVGVALASGSVTSLESVNAALIPAALMARTWNWYLTPGWSELIVYVSPSTARSIKNSSPVGEVNTR
jgi:hypothetical protein